MEKWIDPKWQIQWILLCMDLKVWTSTQLWIHRQTDALLFCRQCDSSDPSDPNSRPPPLPLPYYLTLLCSQGHLSEAVKKTYEWISTNNSKEYWHYKEYKVISLIIKVIKKKGKKWFLSFIVITSFIPSFLHLSIFLLQGQKVKKVMVGSIYELLALWTIKSPVCFRPFFCILAFQS